jgi:mono/diheme cytochrome c family protein
MKQLTAILLFFIGVFFIGCYYDKAALVYPPDSSTCDTTAVTYSTTIAGILNTNCYSCHGGNAASGGGIQLDTYTNLKTYITNGQLMNSINQTGSVAAMPPTGGKLSSCDISKTQAWINAGALNN